jgi:hypothetical protein
MWYNIDKTTGSFTHLGHSELIQEALEKEELKEID